MELAPIFVDENTNEGLFAVIYRNRSVDEFDKIFNQWENTEYVANYFKNNVEYLKIGFFRGTIPELITKVKNEAQYLQDLIYEYATSGFKNSEKTLDQLFVPLHDSETTLPIRQQSKGMVFAEFTKKPILRIYAIRIGTNTFIVTGGAIKITHKMQDHPDLQNELRKIKKVRKFLEKSGISNVEQLTYYYEQHATND